MPSNTQVLPCRPTLTLLRLCSKNKIEKLQARMNRPHGITYDAYFDTLFVADCMNNRVRTIKGNLVSTLL